MNKVEAMFLSNICKNTTTRSMLTAHRLIKEISTNVLISSANELVFKARYLYLTASVESADKANQLAYQIAAELDARHVDTRDIQRKVEENFDMINV